MGHFNLDPKITKRQMKMLFFDSFDMFDDLSLSLFSAIFVQKLQNHSQIFCFEQSKELEQTKR